LRPPLLVISDGAAGLVGAIERILPRSLRQRCLIHYADLRIMPMVVWDPLRSSGFGLARSA
jgi:transposase-like protein